MVFDNVTDLEALDRFVPAAGQCQVIITSTRRETATIGAALAVDVFTDQEALSFLAERTGRSDDVGALQLAADLGCLPLALAQAAAVIAAQHLDYPTYLARLRALPVRDYLTRAVGEPYPHDVAEAILLALDAVAEDDPTGLCRGLVDVVSLLSAAAVSRTLLYAAGQAGVLQHPGGAIAAPERIDEALGRLAAASVVTFSLDGSTASVHRLTMRVAVERQAQEGSLTALGASIAGLLSVVTKSLTQPWQNRPAARDAVQQIMALHEHLAPYLGTDDASLTASLLELRGWAISCLNELEDSFAEVIEYGQALLADSERVLGQSHPDTLTVCNNLAVAYDLAGRLAEAIPLYERTLADCERILGETHPDTLGSRGNLANAYRAAGRLADAIRLHERTLADREHSLGETHADTLTSRNNLANAYRAAGRLAEAEGLRNRIAPNHD